MAFRRKKNWGRTKPSVGYKPIWGDSIIKGLISYWIFNEGAGTSAYDVARGFTGTLTGMANPGTSTSGWGIGKFGQGLNFDGTNDYISVGQGSSILNITGPYSISAWVKTTSVALGFIANKTTGSGTAGYEIYMLNVTGTFNLRNNSIGALTSTTAINDGRWRHVVGTYDGTTAVLYIDGVFNTSGAQPVPTTNTSAAFQIGARAAASTFAGSIDNVRVYNRALTASEVSRLYTEPFAGIETPKSKAIALPGIQFDAASNSGYQAAASSYSWNHTCTGTDRYLTVGISMLSLAQTVSGITYNSVAMTFLGAQNSVSGAARVEMWGLIAPATGTNSIAVTLSGAIASAGNASSYTGVHQTSPTEGFNSAQATNIGAADATVNITTVADNDWVVDIVATDDAAITVGTGQIQTGNVTGAGGSGAMSYEGPKTPAGAVTMSWTNVGALATWSIGGIALRPIASSSLGALLKTWAGLAQASIKTFFGLANASTKTVDDLTNV